MYQFLLYSSIFVALLSFFMCLYACARVGGFINSTKGLDWDAIANITGDLATTKKTLQTLNNRLNGMHSPKQDEAHLMMQLLQSQNAKPNGTIKNVGG